jgi:hypothetical protein
MIQALIFSVFGAFFRRWFGGGFGKFGDVSRFWKYLSLSIAFIAAWFYLNGIDWTALKMYAALVSFMVFWAVGHGTWFVYWDDTAAAEGRIPLIDKIVWFCIGVDESRTFWGNCFGMFVRYTITAIPVAIFTSPLFLTAGAIVALSYVPAGFKQDTRLGECLAGFFVFFLLWWCL